VVKIVDEEVASESARERLVEEEEIAGDEASDPAMGDSRRDRLSGLVDRGGLADPRRAFDDDPWCGDAP